MDFSPNMCILSCCVLSCLSIWGMSVWGKYNLGLALQTSKVEECHEPLPHRYALATDPLTLSGTSHEDAWTHWLKPLIWIDKKHSYKAMRNLAERRWFETQSGVSKRPWVVPTQGTSLFCLVPDSHREMETRYLYLFMLWKQQLVKLKTERRWLFLKHWMPVRLPSKSKAEMQLYLRSAGKLLSRVESHARTECRKKALNSPIYSVRENSFDIVAGAINVMEDE